MPRRRKVGRPRELTRPRNLNMRLGQEHWRLIEAWARERGCTESDAVRRMIERASAVPVIEWK